MVLVACTELLGLGIASVVCIVWEECTELACCAEQDNGVKEGFIIHVSCVN